MSLEDNKIEEYKTTLIDSGFKVMSNEEHTNFVSSHEALKTEALKFMKDKMDVTIYDLTGKKKLVGENGRHEKTVDYYQM